MSDSEVMPLSDEAEDPQHKDMKTTTNYLTNTEITIRKQNGHRIWRTLISIIPFGAVLLSIYEYATFMQTIAFMMLCIFGIPTIRLLFLIYSATHIHRIHAYTKNIPNWMSLSVTYKVGQFEQESVHSISEFCQINGDELTSSMQTMSENIWYLSIVVFIFRLTQFGEEDIVKSVHLDDVFIIIGVFGLLLRGIWHFNPYSFTQRLLHYFGNILWIFVIWAYGIETKFDFDFFILHSLAIILFVIWMLLSLKADKYKGNEPKIVNIYSKLMLTCEIFLIWQGAIALILWTYNQ